MKTLSDFTNLFPLSKTLRFKLIPIGNTLKNIEASGILDEDRHRAESYVKVKAIIDEYHKAFIDRVLSDTCLQTESIGKHNSLEEFFFYYQIGAKSEQQKKTFKKIQDALRKQIADSLTKDKHFSRIDKKELIQEDLIQFVRDGEDAAEKTSLISEFQNFTVYFTGFHENRQNMYSPDEKSTAIAYRLINENLPKFVDNMKVFDRIAASELASCFDELYHNFEEYLQVERLHDIFSLDYFNLLLTQKHIDVYNALIGGKATETGEKIKGLNEYINLYNQRHKQEKLPKFKMLFKQILTDREAISWLPRQFDDNSQLLSAIEQCYNHLSTYTLKDGSLKYLLENLHTYDTEKIFIRNDSLLTEISQRHYGSWSILPEAIKRHLERANPQKRRETYEAYQSRIEKAFKAYPGFSIAFLNGCLTETGKESPSIESYFESLGAVETETSQQENWFARIANAYTDFREMQNRLHATDVPLAQDAEAVARIKKLLDALKGLQLFIKPLLDTGEEAEKDERFYGDFTEFWNELDTITPLYNMVRNYLTRKPYSEEKIKLNFQNPTLLNGWDLNKEVDNTSVILRRNGRYYLAIMHRNHRRVFSQYPGTERGDCYEKMEYKLLPGANKMLPKVFFSKSRIDEFNPSEELLARYQQGTHKKGENFNLHDCHALIDFFKDSIEKHEEWRNFHFKFSDTSSYTDMSGFYREIETQGYKLSFVPVACEYIDELVRDGKIFLFQIYNKDFSTYSKGKPNMHTLYWEMLFDERNLMNVVYKLNGQAEIFFRKASLSARHPEHPAGLPIKKKQAPTEESCFPYDLIKNKRYTVDQFQFHVPITINFKATGTSNINPSVTDYIRTADDLHIIGIDRGERHLLYLVVIDSQGRICEQFSLNKIVTQYQGHQYRTDYHALLQKKEDERQKSRQSWQSIENIKELKEGYLSQVVHKVSELMIKYKAIVVLEELNAGFKRSRQKVEKQVYQKFEKMLIDKLNYLVFKTAEADQPGGLLHAYQLTNKFESFKKMGKQSGFLFYIPAWNTSKIDPTTGFVNLFDTRYENVDKSRAFFGKFDSIRYRADKGTFEWTFDYNNFHKKAEGTRSSWCLSSHGNRVRTFRNPAKNNQWDNEEIDLTQAFRDLFEAWGIEITSNLKEAICNQSEKKFFSELFELFKLMIQLRNSVTGTNIDYMVSPVENHYGTFFDSRTCDSSLPANADANGAYNIARKGLMLARRIQATPENDPISLTLSNKEWLRFAQGLDETTTYE